MFNYCFLPIFLVFYSPQLYSNVVVGHVPGEIIQTSGAQCIVPSLLLVQVSLRAGSGENLPASLVPSVTPTEELVFIVNYLF